MRESLEDIAAEQEVDHVDLLVYLLSKHECFRIKVIAGNFFLHEGDIERLVKYYRLYKEPDWDSGQTKAGVSESSTTANRKGVCLKDDTIAK